MVTFRNNSNNNKKTFFRSNNNRRPSFRRNDEGSKFKTNFSNNDNFQRNISGRNNYNASKLIEKYSELAREALANEDKILSENYFQHADHFTRVLNEQEKNKTTVKTINIQSGKDVIEKLEESKKEDTTKDKNLNAEKQLATS
jgi:hypothetical protein